MARETTLVLVKPDGMRRGLAGEIVARFERRGLELRGARLLKITKAMGREHYAEHRGKPFFSGPRRLHQLGPGARARGERRVGDLGRPDDDGRDEPARLRARDDPRRLRARAAPRTSCTARTRGRARSASSRCSSPTALSEPDYVARNRELWTKTNAEYTDGSAERGVARRRRHVGRLRRPRGRRSASSATSTGLDVVELGCGTAYFSRVARECGAPPGRRRRHPGAARDGAAAAMAETGHRVPARRGERRGCAAARRELRPRGLGVRREPLVRSRRAGSPRRRASSARAGRLVFLTNSMLATLCVPAEPGYATESFSVRSAECTG